MHLNINFFKGFGDTLICSPTIRQLNQDYGYTISVQGLAAKEIYQNNPYCDFAPKEGMTLTPHDLLLKSSNLRPIHQLDYPIDYFNKALGLNMQLKSNRCELFLTEEEAKNPRTKPYILLNPEYQRNITTKKYHKWQEVIDQLAPIVEVIQVGLKREYYKNTTNLSQMTSLRQLFTLVFNAELVIGGESFLNHVCSAFNVPYILVASGFSPKNYYSYPNTTILNRSHSLQCGESGACWKNRVQSLWDGKIEQICTNTLPIEFGERVSYCMQLIEPEDIVSAALPYLDEV